MFLFFADVLDRWIGANGVAYSTQTAAIFRLLRAYYHGAPKGAFVLCGANAAKTTDVIPADFVQPSTVSIRGWKGLTNIEVKVNDRGGTAAVDGELVYVDFIPEVLEQNLGQSSRAFKQALVDLRDLNLLITERTDSFRTQRRVDGKHTIVIRIKAEFFAHDAHGKAEF
jgi:hypothetical protein